jgi:hypothetical protein
VTRQLLVDSRFDNSIYWTLPVVKTIIHFTILQHNPKTLTSEFGIPYCPSWLTNLHFCLLGSMLNSGLRNFPYSLCIRVSRVWVGVLCYDTVRRSVCQSVFEKAPISGLRSDIYYRQTVAGFLMWGALSDERTGLSFTVAAGARLRRIFLSHFRYFLFVAS